MDAGLAALLGRVDADGRLHVDPSWVNSWGIVFGGVAAAALVDRWSAPDLAAVHLAFVAPVRGEHPVEIGDGAVVQDGVIAVQGFAVTARRTGPTTEDRHGPRLPDPDDLPEATGGRSAAFIDHHFDLRVVPRRDRRTVHQWVRLRHLDGDPPLGVVGLLADLASVGVFRTAAKRLDGHHAVLALDLALELTGRPPTPWMLLALDVPPIHAGTAVARVELLDADRRPVATAVQHTVVKALR